MPPWLRAPGWGGEEVAGATASSPAFLPVPPDTRWSTGVIMYTLLAGSPPFWHRKQMLMLRMIMSGNYQFGSPEWDDYSDTVKDLVRDQSFWLLCSREGESTTGERSISCYKMEDPTGKDLMSSEVLEGTLP